MKYMSTQVSTQEVALPLVLPALEDHARYLPEDECSILTKASAVSAMVW